MSDGFPLRLLQHKLKRKAVTLKMNCSAPCDKAVIHQGTVEVRTLQAGIELSTFYPSHRSLRSNRN